MKIRGKKIEGANEAVIVIPRASGSDIILRARAVLDMGPFSDMCPVPTPPERLMAGGKKIQNLKDSGYLAQITKYSTKRLSWLVLISLEATEGLEWETVDVGDPSTWDNFQKEMTDSGFSDVEIQRIVNACVDVNALNDDKIEEARERFLSETREQGEE